MSVEFAFVDINAIKFVLVLVGFPKYAAISPRVSKSPGAELTNALNWLVISVFVYASMPLIVILLSSDDKLILVPGNMFFYYISK